jgi:hypothetical protein
MMLLQCPACGESFDLSALQKPGGMGGGCYCPKCQERVYLSSHYSRGVGIVSLLIALGGLTLAGVRTVDGLLLGTALIWVPLSLFLNAATMNIKPPILRKWKPRRRTFFEWLYDRDKPPELFDKQHH